MTSANEIKAEIMRQQSRLVLTTDKTNAAILSASIIDLLALYKAYPTKLLWMVANGPGAADNG